MKARLLAVALLPLLLALPVAAERGDGGSSAVDLLRLGTGAAPAAQGEAYVARGGVIDALHYNPAGLAWLPRTTLQLQHNEYLSDMRAEYAAVAAPWRNYAFGGSVHLFDAGSFTRRTLTNPGGAGNFDAGTQIYSLGAAARLLPELGAGVTLRFAREEIDNAQRNAYAADLGLLYRHAGSGVEVAGAVRNLGPKTKFDYVEEELPMETALGVHVPLQLDWRSPADPPRLRLAAEVAWPRRQEADYRLGLEVRPLRPLALRAGWNTRNDLASDYSLGVGFNWQNYAIDYAYIPFKHAGNAHRVSLNIEFGDAGETAP